MASKRISTSELDFDGIKSNLKSYLQGQSQFSDYDFEGSGLSVLLDILAYNTHYNALYTNLAVNEMFLDSASKRESVVSLAKTLGYTPSSARAPIATVDVRVTSPSSTPATLTIPKYTAFNTTIQGTTYQFYTNAEYTASLSGGEYLFEDIQIKEGVYLQNKVVKADGVQFKIPNAGADLSTLTVSVQESSSSAETETYYIGENLSELTSTSLMYLVKEIENEQYEVIFGDGTVGKALDAGNVVTLKYLVTNSDAANGANSFTYAGSSLAGGTVVVTTVGKAAGGADIEDIESIRYNAPKHYSAQNRGVTTADYEALVQEEFGNIQAMSVWGGEDNDPPVYGKVYLSIKPEGADALTAAEKTRIINEILKPKNIVSITPEIVDPDYIHIAVSTAVYYNPRLTTRSSNDIKSIVESTIQTYNDTDLEEFDSIFRHSKLSRLIDTSESSIMSNVTTITLHKPVEVIFNANAKYEYSLINPLYNSGVPENVVTSTPFYISGDSENEYQIDDDGEGNLRLFYYVGSNVKNYTDSAFGTVDYDNGKITIPNLNITAYGTGYDEMKLFLKPSSNDVVSARNQIVQVLDDEITVSVVTDSTALGNYEGGTNFVFTTSRT